MPLLLNQLLCAGPVAFKGFLPHLLGRMKTTYREKPRGPLPALAGPVLVTGDPVPLQPFEVHNEHMWKVLLSHLQASMEHFTQEQLKKVTLPQASPGQHDTSDSLVPVTLYSLGVLVSLLGP